MGLDVSLYNKAMKEVLYLRNHQWFFLLLLLQDAENCDQESSDFYVSVGMLYSAMRNVETRMAPAAVLQLKSGSSIPLLDDLTTIVPAGFNWGEPDDIPASLPHYWTLFVHLLAWAKVDRVLVCSWSS